MQALEDILKMLADCSFGQAELSADFGITASGSDEPEQFPLASSQPRRTGPAPLGVPVDVLQMRAEQSQQQPVAFVEVSALSAEQQPKRPSGNGRQAYNELVLDTEMT